MPTSETRIAARDKFGVEVYYQHSSLPTKENVEAYETFHKGAAKIMLDMAVEDQHQYWIATLNKFLSNIVNVRGFAKNLFAYCLSEHCSASAVRQD